jgi:hypothetical protein
MPDYALGGKPGRRSALYIAGMLLDCSRQHSLQRWGEFGSGFQTVVVIKRGDLDRGLRLLGTSPNEIANSRFRSLTAQIELAETLAHAGRIADGLALVEAGIEQSDGAWGTPELLRLKGELLLTAQSSCGPRRLAPRPPGPGRHPFPQHGRTGRLRSQDPSSINSQDHRPGQIRERRLSPPRRAQ